MFLTMSLNKGYRQQIGNGMPTLSVQAFNTEAAALEYARRLAANPVYEICVFTLAATVQVPTTPIKVDRSVAVSLSEK